MTPDRSGALDDAALGLARAITLSSRRSPSSELRDAPAAFEHDPSISGWGNYVRLTHADRASKAWVRTLSDIQVAELTIRMAFPTD